MEHVLKQVTPRAENLSDLIDLISPMRRVKLIQVLLLVDLKLKLEPEEYHARRQDGRLILE